MTGTGSGVPQTGRARSTMVTITESNENPPVSIPPRPHALTFWLLTVLATAVFIPCVLVPVWMDYKAIVLAERLEAREVARLRTNIDRLDRHLRALQNDPAVIARVAQRDLAFTLRNTTIIPVDTIAVTASEPASPPIAPVEPPPVVATLLEWVPFTRRAQLFADPASRTVLICLSGALLATAFALFPPHPQVRRPGYAPRSGRRRSTEGLRWPSGHRHARLP